jgi:hypothetical protein
MSFHWQVIVRFLRPCYFRKLTGIPCPTCGATRTATALTEGRVLDALLTNPLLTVLTIGFLVGGLAVIPFWLSFRGPVPVFKSGTGRRYALALAGLVLLNWIYLIFTS